MHRTSIRGRLGLVTGVAIVLALALTGGLAGAEHPPEYLALGDSVSVGVGASDPAVTGFVPRFRAAAAGVLTPGASPAAPGAQGNAAYLFAENLAVGGETSASLIAGGQLAAALEALTRRNGNDSPADDVEVVTLTIGGNDMKHLFAVCGSGDPSGPPSAECQAAVVGGLTAFQANLAATLVQLRTAAGPGTAIIVMTYYNPLIHPGCPYHPFAGFAQQVVYALNATIAGVAAAVPGVAVADVAGAGIGVADLQPDCLHPSDSGHAKIAAAFEAAFAAP